MKKIAIALRILFALLILSLGVSAQLKGWGSNDRGKLGIGNVVTPLANPFTITGLPDATAASGNSQYSIFLKANGRIFSSGDNQLGQLGNGNVTSQGQVTPGQVMTLGNVTQITAGFTHAVALRTDGTVWAWGKNDIGQIGNGTISTQLSCLCMPFPLQTTISDVVQIDAGASYSLALKSDGTVWAWGTNGLGQLGDNSTTLRRLPVQVGIGVAGFNNIIAVSAGDYHAMALKADGTVWVWGWNEYGQAGNGTAGGSSLQPVQNTTLSDVVQISAGSVHSVVLKKDGTIWTWGQNRYGQAGNGAFDDQGCQCVTLPQQNTLIANPVEIAAFHFGTFIRQSDGSIWAWGRNLEGTIGNGTVSSSGCQCQPSPAQTSVGTGNAFIDSGVSSGYAAIPSFSTSTSVNSVWQFGKNVTFIFQAVTTAGVTGYTSLDPAATGLNVPPGYTVQNRAPAYNITSTVVSPANYVCLSVPSEYDPSEFALLKILHEEAGDLVDRTVSSVFIKRQVCAETPSFGRLVVAKGTTPTPAAVTVWGRILNTAGQGVGNATVNMTDERGILRQAITGTLGYYSFDSVKPLESYTVEPTAKRYRFPQRTVTVVGNLADLNFTSQ